VILGLISSSALARKRLVDSNGHLLE